MKFRLFDDRTRQLAQPALDAKRNAASSGVDSPGASSIAIEPFLGMIFMALLTWGIVYRSQHVAAEHDL